MVGHRAANAFVGRARATQPSVNDLYKPIVHSKCLLPQDHKPTSNWGNKCHFFLFLRAREKEQPPHDNRYFNEERGVKEASVGLLPLVGVEAF